MTMTTHDRCITAQITPGDAQYPFRVTMHSDGILQMISPRYAHYEPATAFASALADAGFSYLPDCCAVFVEHWDGNEWRIIQALTNDAAV